MTATAHVTDPITAAFDAATAAAHITTPAPTAARTPAKSTDRRRSYPLAEADRKLLAAVPFIEDAGAGDLDGDRNACRGGLLLPEESSLEELHGQSLP